MFMKLFDCQIEKLKDYRGIGEIPKDYDEYWNRAKAEMEKMPIYFRLVPASFFVIQQKLSIYILQELAVQKFTASF